MKQSRVVLIGVGLVLIGLLTGILGMLYLGERGSEAPQFIRQVQLGADEAGSGGPADTSRRVSARGAAATPAVATLRPARLNAAFRRVAERVTPAVVYVQVASGGQGASRNRPDGSPPENFEDDLQRRFFGPRRSVGSGIIISKQGHVVTNNHVVQEAEQIWVTLADKRRFEAELVGADASTDLAVLKLDGASDLPVIALGNSDNVEVGDWVLAVGNPFRLTSTVTAGIVSALGRQVGIIDNRFGIENFIQTDAAINPGNSGGALVNLRGELVGISTAIASEGGSYEGYGFAVPVNLVKRVSTDLIQRGEVERGFLGVGIRNIDARRARQLGLNRIGGVYIDEVRPGGAAARAGLKGGDVVLSIEGRPVNAANELQSAVAQQRPGDTLSMNVWHDGKRRTVKARLLGRDAPAYRDWLGATGNAGSAPGDEEKPEDSSEGWPGLPETPSPGGAPDEGRVSELEGWGLGLRALTEREREAFGHSDGAYVAYVGGETQADQAGLPRDVVLTAIEGQAIHSVDQALKILKRSAAISEPTLLRVKRRDGTSAFFELEPPE